MKKRKSPAYRPKKSGSGLRSFLVTLLGSAAIALLGAGVWQLLDPVEYQPPLEPLTSSPLAASGASSLGSEGSTPADGSSEESAQPPAEGDSSQEPGGEDTAQDPQVAEEIGRAHV